MRKNFKSVAAITLAGSMVLGSLAGCGNSNNTTTTAAASSAAGSSAATTTEAAGSSAAEESTTEGTGDEYYDTSKKIYDEVLGDFLSAYEKADEATTVSERFALQAISEAKLLEAGTMLPIQAAGGNYAISRIVPHTSPYSLWGNDQDRYFSSLVCNEIIKASDIAACREKWGELRGTGTYYEWAKNYMTEQGYTFTDQYGFQAYSSDPQTWDGLATSQAADNEAIVNTFDGLYMYDCEGTPQPALAESYEVSDDGLTYTFKIKQGLEWDDSQGRKVSDVTADDFVAGMQHALDAQGGLEYLVDGVIKNAGAYISGEITDFAEVGVKAVDDYTLEYTLEAPTSYFTTMLGYGIFAPMSRAYYTSQGGKFGAEFDAAATDYTYGATPENIAYCGPYLVTSMTSQNSIVFKANPTYWGADTVACKTLTWVFNDGTDVLQNYNNVLSGKISGSGLNSAAATTAKADGNFDTYCYIATPNATTYSAFYNINRTLFANFNDDSAVKSEQTEEDAARTNKAMMNQHFRLALSFATDRVSYNAQTVGDDLAAVSLRNMYTPGNFVSLEEDTTVSINGTDTKFAKGTYYGEIVQAQLDADDVKITVWDPAGNDGAGSSDGFDGWYNVDNAKAELEAAIADLTAEGVTIDKANPIQIDLPYASNSETYSNRAQAYKQSIESALDGMVQVNLVKCNDNKEWYYAGYYAESGQEANYDVYDVSGWGPDYGDPKTYLDTYLPDYAGYVTKNLGIY